MAGYNGYSMSNNAVEAYNNGEKPLSKWTKSEILEAIKTDEIELKCSMEMLKKMPVKSLKKIALYNTSWHHTSSHYNRTDFYSLDSNKLEELTDEELSKIIEESKQNKKNDTEIVEERWKCAFLEWSGSRKHFKAIEVIEDGIIKGDWFIRADSSKKKTTANGFRFVEKL